MNFIPIDVANTQPQSGGMSVPEGFYLLQIEDATQVKPTQAGDKQFRHYKSKIVMGPGYSQEYVGKPYTDKIMEGDPQWAGRHMELFVAALGSLEAVRQVGAQYGGKLPAEVLGGRYYIVQLVKNDKYVNVVQRIAYTPENWAANAAGNGNGQAATPVGGGMLTQQAQQFAAPQAPAPAPQQYAAPTLPQAPQGYAPPPAGMPGNGMPPLPPPPPGMPAGR